MTGFQGGFQGYRDEVPDPPPGRPSAATAFIMPGPRIKDSSFCPKSEFAKKF